MAKPSKRQRGAKDQTRRGALKKAEVGDLLARADGPDAAKGGAVTAREAAQPAAYQHNQTNLEFLR
jgi:hypothetical protein